jgi:hypothetical protein
MKGILYFILRGVMVGITCYLVATGSLIAAAIIIGAYWILIEMIQLQIVFLMLAQGMVLREVILRRRHDLN